MLAHMTANRIREAALAMFAEAGYDGVTLAEIAKAVGIKTPSIYAHFASKERLFLALFEEAARKETDRFAAFLEARAGGSCEAAMFAAFGYCTDEDRSTGGQAFLKRTMLMPPRHLKARLQEQFMRYEAAVTEQLARMLETGMASGELPRSGTAEAVAVFYALVDGLLVESQLYSTEVYRERQRVAWAAFWKVLSGG